MYNELLTRMKLISKLDWLKVNSDLITEQYAIDPNGNYVTHGFIRLGFIKNNDNIYEYSNVNIIKTISLIVLEKESDVKLEIINGEGHRQIVHPKNREIQEKGVEYLFGIEDVPLAVNVICPEGSEYSLFKIRILGNDITELIDIIKGTGDIYDEVKESEDKLIEVLNKDLAELKEKKSELDKEIKLLIETNNRLHETKDVEETQLKQTRELVGSVRAELTQSNLEVNKNRELLSKQSKELRETERNLKVNSEDIEKKLVHIESLDGKIQKYKEEESLFSEDFSSFKEEVRNQNRYYYLLLTVFIFITCTVCFIIYKNALSTVDNFQFNFDLWTLLVSRLPIIFINLFLLGALTSVIYFLINLITANSINIAKTKQISYLVKECVDSQKIGLDNLSDDAILKQRVESKMDLIKSLIISKVEDTPQQVNKPVVQEILKEFLKKEEKPKSK
ncbi:hypothetical protein ACG9VX_001883 [Vibrio alginolyticus]